MKNRPNRMVVAIYSHPEYYPPTLNALDKLASVYSEIVVVHRNVIGFDWVYPENVTLVSKGKVREVAAAEEAGLYNKMVWFIRFTWLFFSMVLRFKPQAILIYDFMPVLSYRLFSWMIHKPERLWYHNHDVGDPRYLQKFSLSRMGWNSEKWMFSRLNLFSLPAMERKRLFPMNSFKGRFYFLPNYPSLARYQSLQEFGRDQGNGIKLLYQGSIGPDHGLEEIISILSKPVNGEKAFLVLKGFIQKAYKEQLEGLAKESGVFDQLIFLKPTGYLDVIRNALTCHIGIAIHKKQDIMNSTLGTASNKIYEYAASGLPVILYDNEHFRELLSDRSWVFFTDSSPESLYSLIKEIMMNYENLSAGAKRDFRQSLNFEFYFNQLLPALSQ